MKFVKFKIPILRLCFLALVIFGVQAQAQFNLGGFFSKTAADGFDVSTLSSAWTVSDPLGQLTYSLTSTPGWLTITYPTGYVADCWTTAVNCVRILRTDKNVDGTYEVRFGSEKGTVFAQSWGLIFYNNSSNFLRVEFGFYSGSTSGKVDFRCYKVIAGAGSSCGAANNLTMGTTSFAIRVVKAGNVFNSYYRIDSGSWVSAFAPTQALTINSSGIIFTANNPGITTTAKVDYIYFPR